MAEAYQAPYLDSSVYIAFIKNEPGREDSGRILRAAEDGQFRIVASTLVQAEVVRPPGGLITPEAENTLRRFFQRDMFVWVEVDLSVARHAATLAREHGLKPADAIHVATAVLARADAFLAWDGGFPWGDRVEGVPVSKPYFAGQQRLSDDL